MRKPKGKESMDPEELAARETEADDHGRADFEQKFGGSAELVESQLGTRVTVAALE